MLTELLLAGVATAGVGLKSATSGDLFAKEDIGFVHEAQIDPSIFEKVPVASSKDLLSYNGNPNFWQKEYEREKENNNNDNVYYSQVISPFFKGDDEYVDYDGFSNTIIGDFYKLNGSSDTDYYRFYLYGNANIELTYNGPISVDFSMFLINGSTGNITNQVDPDIYNQTNSNKAITGDFAAGAYCVRVVGNTSTNNSDYQISITANYKKEVNYNMGYQKNQIHAGGLMWVSDFDPLDIACFEHENKKVEIDKNKLDITMESSLLEKKILQSSLYLWSGEAKKLAYDMVIKLHEETQKKLDKYNAEKAYYEDLAATCKIIDGVCHFMIDVVLAIISDGASTVFEKVACFLVSEAIGFAMDSFTLEDWARSFIPENEIMGCEELLAYFTNIETALYVGSFSNKIVINLFSYYTLTYNESEEELELKRVYDFDVEKTVYSIIDEVTTTDEDEMVYAIQPETWMKGRIYQLKKVGDFNDAKKHIKHTYQEEDPIGIQQIFEKGGQNKTIDSWGSAWFWFRAPVTATYQFLSSGDVPTTDTLAAELFNGVVPGTSNEGMIRYDDSDGYTGHFWINYYMEEDEIVFIRVHGKNWKTRNAGFCMNVFRVESADFTMNEESTYEEVRPNLCLFERDATLWLSMQFSTDGSKIVQNFATDSYSRMKICNFRGEEVATTGNVSGGFNSNGFISFEAEADIIYFLKVYSPRYAHTTMKMKITVASVDEKFSNINDIEKLCENNKYNINLKQSKAHINLFVPTKKQAYQFVGCEGVKVDIYDSYDGLRINKESLKDLNRSNGFYEMMDVPEYKGISFLQPGHQYFILTSMVDPNRELMSFALDVKTFSNGFFVNTNNISARFITSQEGYYEQQNVLGGSSTEATTIDSWYRFETSGYRIFTLFGNCTNLRLELFDENNTLLEEDKNSKGTSSTSFICYQIQANKNYRIRIVDTRFLNYSVTAKLTITLVPELIDSFASMNRLRSSSATSENNGYINYGNNKYGGCNAVGFFKPDKRGYYSFSMDGAYGKSLKVSVIDTNASSYIVKDVDFSGGEGYASHGAVLKYLWDDRNYYVVYSDEELIDGYAPDYQLRITYYGNGGSGNSVVEYSAGKDTEDLYAVYVANQTGYICADTTIYASNSSVADTVSVHEITFDNCYGYGYYTYGDSSLKTITKSHRQAVFFHATKGTKYMLKISKSGYTSSSGSIYVYYRDPSLYPETDYFHVNKTDTDMRYAEKICSLYGKQNMTYDLRYEVGGKKIIQTFGSSDTILELRNNSGTLLARDDNNGYKNNAFISYNLQSNVTYKLVVSLKNTQDFGQIKTTITPVSNSNYYSSYNDLRLSTMTSSSGTRTLSFYVYQQTSDVYRFKPSYSGYYTFTLRSEDIDSYLHVIDPSNSKLKGSNDYNDDGDGSDSVISRKYLYAGCEYFIIASSYYFADDQGSATLTITK